MLLVIIRKALAFLYVVLFMDINILDMVNKVCVESWPKLIFRIKAKNFNEIIYVCNRVNMNRLLYKFAGLKHAKDYSKAVLSLGAQINLPPLFFFFLYKWECFFRFLAHPGAQALRGPIQT